ncbi:YkgJ family cysteine cluster protein [Derxia gummosa]|uniref:YkgJ family cysteine cluster protein n=1 Tax=Derxia gummosa DSM 723 TaxID=1121388 RepID=A0A8B6X3A6_9BURK|nr:YkgJ family cysteine cluster protein [Derxia gummosa]
MNTANPADAGPLAFFKALHDAYSQTIARFREGPKLVDALLSQAFDSFEGNVAIQSEGQPTIACHKGCATCCTLRVTATSPEILLIARYMRMARAALAKMGIDLEQRVIDADKATRGLSEQERVKLRRRCPFIEKGACLIYPVRPLACRGHASHDVKACVDAASGRADSVPYSEPHLIVRSLVQNAMQSALRDAGYVWSIHELNHGLVTALADDLEPAWLAGGEPLAGSAVADDVGQSEMARTFDAIKAA